MRANRVREIWAEGGFVANGWLAIPSAISAEAMAHQGWDSVTVDMQHGVVGYQEAVNMLTAISTTPAVPLARVPWLDQGMIMKMLDAGAMGVICPMINTRAQAEELVAACRYAPVGNRSVGPVRAVFYAGDDYLRYANQTVIASAMIETLEAVENLDDILSVEGLDAIYVGPSDLSMSMGVFHDGGAEHPRMQETLGEIAKAALAHGVAPGIHTPSAEFAKRMVGLGYRLVTIANDLRLMVAKAADEVRQLKG